MRWSWRIGRIIGIDVYVHATFPLLLLWIALTELGGGASARTVAWALVTTLIVFLVVVLHECGHAAVARHYGIRTRDITLLPIGGIARLERMPREPRQELLVALAGPAVNVVLAALLYGALLLMGGPPPRSALGQALPAASLTSLLSQLVAINLWLAAFNLLPAFPMDGGRVLRALVAMRTHDAVKATMTAARVGRGFALAFGLIGIFLLESPALALIALFIWIAATSESLAVQTTAALEHVPLSGVMITDFKTLAPNDTLMRAAELTIDGFQQDFPVLDHGGLAGMLTQRELLRGLTERGSAATVGEVMERDCPTVAVDDQADTALERLRSLHVPTLPVLEGRDVVGMLTPQNVAEFVSLRAASGGNGGRER